MSMTAVFNAYYAAMCAGWSRRPLKKARNSKQIQQGSFKARARRARGATATGTVSPLAGFSEFFLVDSKLRQNRFQRIWRRIVCLDQRHRDARHSARRRFVSPALPPPLATCFRAFPRPQIPHLRCPQLSYKTKRHDDARRPALRRSGAAR